MKSVKFDRFWSIDRAFGLVKEDDAVISEDYLVFPGTTTDMDVEDLQNRTVEKVARRIMENSGSWSCFYYSKSLDTVFIGRDIFGRQSLVAAINDNELIVGCRTRGGGEWQEVPYGQVTAIHGKEVTVYTYLLKYPDDGLENWKSLLNVSKVAHVEEKQNLLHVSRRNDDLSPASEELFRRTVEGTKRLLRLLPNGSKNVGVCLSGGVDSTLIAHAVRQSLADDFTIDLINVAFGSDKKNFSQAPDRKRAEKALESFRTRYPEAKFRLILANVDANELNDCRQKYIAAAASPATSVLDDSLACVLWFAVRAKGIDFDTNEAVSSPAKILFVGSGADELFAGYARHRTRFEKDGIPEDVAEECEKELLRLGTRNGGRDARVAAQLDKILLSPLLEDDLVEWANDLAVGQKWDLSLPRGQGEKRILREAVRSLGSPYDAPKQAMQFGSRMAKLTNIGGDVKGSDRSPHLVHV